MYIDCIDPVCQWDEAGSCPFAKSAARYNTGRFRPPTGTLGLGIFAAVVQMTFEDRVLDLAAGIEMVVILLLILAQGFFVAAEIAIIAAKRGRLKQLADDGDKKAALALDLALNPDRFLPTAQVGITVISVAAAAFGGARLTDELATWFQLSEFSLLAKNAHRMAFTLVVASISFLTILLGELVPKRIGLSFASSMARVVAGPIDWLARIGKPAIWVLNRCSAAVLFLLRIRVSTEPSVSIDDVEHLVRTGTAEGVFESVEQKLVVEALRLGDRTVKDIMRPRIDIDAVSVDTPAQEVLGAISMAGFSRLPVYEGDLDHIIGFVQLKDVVRYLYMGWPIDLKKLQQPALFVPETLSIDRLLQLFQEKKSRAAIVLDEFGGTEGMVTLDDVLEELVGEIAYDRIRDSAQRVVARPEGGWLVDGAVTIDELVEKLELRPSFFPANRSYSTLAGLILNELRQIPNVGDQTTFENLDLEVVDMDGNRIDRVLIHTAGTFRPTSASGIAVNLSDSPS